MKLKHLFAAVALILACAGFQSCNSDNEEGDQLYSNIVTFRGTQGNLMSFDYQELNNGPVYSLTSQPLNSDMQPGTRFMAMFSVPAGTQLANGLNVNLLEAHKAANLKVITNEPVPADFTSTRALYATQLVRSGNWLNLVALMPASTEANGITLKLIADPATLGTEEVSLYMVYDNTVSQGASNNAVYYATFDVSTLIANPTTKKLTVHINTSNSTIPTIVEFNNLR